MLALFVVNNYIPLVYRILLLLPFYFDFLRIYTTFPSVSILVIKTINYAVPV